ncbi:7688_t:CDS:2 [Cetraspora pellucida]|uniref:7688_t:CDS:1 n=1 Tax=Cetraspora pellucida TaxID=1433469 RepID=A0ACA9MAS4_9GLOM|nr:7688_t:CDS:2 [Cetraspora pellucida]
MTEKIILLLIGKTGNGKSTLANVLTVIDTPGICDTKPENEKGVYKEIVEAVYGFKNGLNQILFVTRGRFTEEERNCYNLLCEAFFSKDIVKFITIVRTNFPNFEDEDECKNDIKEMIDEGGELSNLIKSCGKKVIHVDNNPKYSKERKNCRVILLDHLAKCKEIYQHEISSSVEKNPRIGDIKDIIKQIDNHTSGLMNHKKRINSAKMVGNIVEKAGGGLALFGAATSEQDTGAFAYGNLLSILGKGTKFGTGIVQGHLEKKYNEHLKRISERCRTLKLEGEKLIQEGCQDFEKLDEFSEKCVLEYTIEKFPDGFCDHFTVQSFERDNDLLNEALSERTYREMFLTPLITKLFQKKFKDMEIYFGEKNLFASAEDFDLKKDDKKNRSNGRKIDIVWATRPLKIEFAIAEISGPPNEHQHSHYFSDKIKIAKMLKVMLNRIVRIYGGVKTNLNLLKLYGLQVYNHMAIVYELSISYKGTYIFREVNRTNLPTTSVNTSLLRRCVPTFLHFKEIIFESLRNINQYITEAGLSTPIDNENANLFLTPMTYSPFDGKTNG